MNTSADDTLDEDGTLADAVAGDDELGRTVDVAPPDADDSDDSDAADLADAHMRDEGGRRR